MDELKRILQNQFGPEDIHVVLHYGGEQTTANACARDVYHFLKKVNRRCRKQGCALNWIVATEMKRMSNVHHHVILSGYAYEYVQQCWEEIAPNGNVTVRKLGNQGDYDHLSRYLYLECTAKLPVRKETTWFLCGSGDPYKQARSKKKALRQPVLWPPSALKLYMVSREE